MTDFPDLKIKALINFPSNAIGGTGVDVEKVNGNFVIDLAYNDFAPPVSGVLDPTHQNVLLWNSITGAYALTPISLFGGGGGIPDAPNDGVQYGRQSLTWTPVVAGSTVLPATATPLVESGSGTVGTSVKYAREDHVHPASGGGGGSGDVTGPASAVASRIATFSGTTGKIIQDSGSLASDFATPTSVTTAIASSAVRYDASQSLTTGQKQQAVTNVGLTGILDAWTAYTPTATVAGGGAGTATGRYKQIGKTMFVAVTANVTTGGTSLTISLPAGTTSVTGVTQYMVGREVVSTGTTWLGSIPPSSTTINTIQYNNNFAVTTGMLFGLSGSFEVA